MRAGLRRSGTVQDRIYVFFNNAKFVVAFVYAVYDIYMYFTKMSSSFNADML